MSSTNPHIKVLYLESNGKRVPCDNIFITKKEGIIMRGLRIISRIYLSLAAIATAVLWFFPWVQVREGIAGSMSSLNSLIQLFITDAEQSAAVEKVLLRRAFRRSIWRSCANHFSPSSGRRTALSLTLLRTFRTHRNSCSYQGSCSSRCSAWLFSSASGQ